LQLTGSSSGGNTLSWSAIGLPPGLSIDSSTGLITGTATTNGTYSTTITVGDSTDASDSVAFTWTVSPDTVTVAQPGSQTGFAQAQVTVQLTGSSGFGFTPLTWTATGLPAGLQLGAGTGLITGAPAKAGRYQVTVTATDTDSTPGSVSFTWTVTADAGQPVRETSARVCLNDNGSLASAGSPVTVAACKASGAQDWQLSAKRGELRVFGLCLADPEDGGTGTALALATCKHATAQEWTYKPEGKSGGEYVLKLNGKCLTDPKDSRIAGTKVTITACKKSTSQKWTKP
jgi:Ricin-type beta-trefoil lectin domain/Putative Ig domain